MLHYKTNGTCSVQIDLEIENGVITHCQIHNGCRGNTQGVAKLVLGRNAEEMAALLARYGAGVVVPFHTDIMEKKHGSEWTRAYLARVGEKLAQIAPGSLFLDPEPLKWYTFGVAVEGD